MISLFCSDEQTLNIQSYIKDEFFLKRIMEIMYIFQFFVYNKSYLISIRIEFKLNNQR